MDQITPDLLSWAIRSSSWHYHNVDSQYQQFVFQHSSPQRNCELQHSFPQQIVFSKTQNPRSYVHPGFYVSQRTNHMPFPSHAATDIELPWYAQ
jgi:hypothetical protein